MVQETAVPADPSLTFGQLWESYPYCLDGKWEEIETDRGASVVQYQCYLDMEDYLNEVLTQHYDRKHPDGNARAYFEELASLGAGSLAENDRVPVLTAQYPVSAEGDSFEEGYVGIFLGGEDSDPSLGDTLMERVLNNQKFTGILSLLYGFGGERRNEAVEALFAAALEQEREAVERWRTLSPLGFSFTGKEAYPDIHISNPYGSRGPMAAVRFIRGYGENGEPGLEAEVSVYGLSRDACAELASKLPEGTDLEEVLKQNGYVPLSRAAYHLKVRHSSSSEVTLAGVPEGYDPEDREAPRMFATLNLTDSAQPEVVNLTLNNLSYPLDEAVANYYRETERAPQ